MNDRSIERFGQIPRYPLPWVAQSLDVPYQTLYSWTKESDVLPPVRLDETARPIRFSFFNLIEARLIAVLRAGGMSLQRIRKALHHASEVMEIDRLLITERFKTDGKNIFIKNALSKEHGDIYEDATLRRGQREWGPIIEHTFKDIDYRYSIAEQLWPAGRNVHIIINPMVEFGYPVLEKTGIPASAIADRVVAGDSEEFVADDFGVGLEDVKEALDWHRHPRLLQLAA